MQEQTQNDKMVPIDTSGEPVEVELKEESQTEEVKTTEPEVQVEEVPQEKPKQEAKEEGRVLNQVPQWYIDAKVEDGIICDIY